MPSLSQTPSRLRKRWSTADHEQRRHIITDAALDLLDRKGRDAVTIRRVADRLGVGAMTLYTYVSGRAGLRQEMIRKGFDLLHASCEKQSTLKTQSDWRGGAKAYVRFAVDHPHLYHEMFATRLDDHDEAERAILLGGFEPLLQKVRDRLVGRGLNERQVEKEARLQATRFWIALHGYATLLIANRLTFLERDTEEIFDDLLERYGPD